jgi:hypothetical protein
MARNQNRKEGTELISFYQRHRMNYQPNIITNSRQGFSLVERSIWLRVINHFNNVSRDGGIDTSVNHVLMIPLTELTESNHSRIQIEAKKLLLKPVILKKGTMINKNLELMYDSPMMLFTSILPVTNKDDGKKYLRISINKDVLPTLLELGRKYTKYDLDTMLSLQSVYSQRIFEILVGKAAENKRVFTMSVEEMRYMLNAPKKYDFKDFRVYCLEHAQKELLEKGVLTFEFLPSKKEGKAIVELEFKVVSTSSETAIISKFWMDWELIPISEKQLWFKGAVDYYQFRPDQRKAILESAEQNTQLHITFLEVDSIFNWQAKNSPDKAPLDWTRAMVTRLGWGKKD